jgi:hypothetical protein
MTMAVSGPADYFPLHQVTGRHPPEFFRHKLKLKLFLCLTEVPRHEDVWGSGGTASCILHLGTR